MGSRTGAANTGSQPFAPLVSVTLRQSAPSLLGLHSADFSSRPLPNPQSRPVSKHKRKARRIRHRCLPDGAQWEALTHKIFSRAQLARTALSHLCEQRFAERLQPTKTRERVCESISRDYDEHGDKVLTMPASNLFVAPSSLLSASTNHLVLSPCTRHDCARCLRAPSNNLLSKKRIEIIVECFRMHPPIESTVLSVVDLCDENLVVKVADGGHSRGGFAPSFVLLTWHFERGAISLLCFDFDAQVGS